MPRKYDVLWTDTAASDLEAVVMHVAADSKNDAIKIFEKVTAKAASLEKFPERGRVIPELKEQGISIYREIIISPWRLIYRISDDSVRVLAFFDSRRNLEDILLNRFIGG